jgi:hypothetical protein
MFFTSLAVIEVGSPHLQRGQTYGRAEGATGGDSVGAIMLGFLLFLVFSYKIYLDFTAFG